MLITIGWNWFSFVDNHESVLKDTPKRKIHDAGFMMAEEKYHNNVNVVLINKNISLPQILIETAVLNVLTLFTFFI